MNKAVLIAIGLTLASAEVAAQGSVPVQLGPRPFYLLDQLAQGELRQQLEQCRAGPFHTSDFSIAHRGASLQFPEHTREAYLAAARMGAGIMECDVTFTRDKQLVCRHAQCDLHLTTDILQHPDLAKKCSVPFQAADPSRGQVASARCCTSDITLAEFYRLKGKMDGANPNAATVEEYLAGTPTWRTDLYAATGTLMSFADSIDLFQSLGLKMTPELKAPEVAMPFNGFSQTDYAESAVLLLRQKQVQPQQVFMQSFSWPDIAYWLEHHPDFAQQAVYLDDRVDDSARWQEAIESLPNLRRQGLRIVAPPLWALLSLDEQRNIIPSAYARAAQAADLEMLTWTLERSGHISRGDNYYYQSIQAGIHSEGDIYRVLSVLHRDIGVLGVFSDWPAAVTFYANCSGIKTRVNLR